MKNLVKISEKSITDQVFNRVNELDAAGAIDFPANYSVGNALKSAFLILKGTETRDKKPVLEACTKESIFNSLLDMVVQGLNPAKNQCYFIPYGSQLQLSRSYLGTVALTKRLKGVKDVVGYPIYNDDEFELGFDFKTAKMTIKSYQPSGNKDPKNIKGAVGLIIGDEGILHVEYMDMAQIITAWGQGATKGNSPAHKNFPDQMAVKTVINRACKLYVNTADDSDKIARFISITKDVDDSVEAEIEENQGSKTLEIGESVVDSETGEIIEEREELTPKDLELNNDVKAPF